MSTVFSVSLMLCLGAILVIYDYRTNQPKTQQLETINIYCLTQFLRVMNLGLDLLYVSDLEFHGGRHQPQMQSPHGPPHRAVWDMTYPNPRKREISSKQDRNCAYYKPELEKTHIISAIKKKKLLKYS